MKLKRNSLFLVITFLMLGCTNTPVAVKQLSNEIVKINQSYHESLAPYFSIIENFFDAQVKQAELLLEETDEDLEALYKELVKMELEQENPDIDAILDEFEYSVGETQDNIAMFVDLSAQL